MEATVTTTRTPIPTKTIDCVIMSTSFEINILSIHPIKKQSVPTSEIITPVKPEALVLPVSFENNSAQENLEILGFINKGYFCLYIN
jgi:hypothetical protein